MLLQRMLVFSLLCVLSSVSAFALGESEINFALLVVNGEQRNAYSELVNKFERHYPSIKVNMQAVEQESYKEHFELWLNADSRSDVMFWFGGERLNEFVRQGLIDPVDNLWERYNWAKKITNSAHSVSVVKGKEFGLPIHYYNWGIYYNKELFSKYNLVEPQTWEEFLTICEKLKAEGITPISLGSKDDWPVAGWFDYLNLRLNGLGFHQELMSGEISYLDGRVRNVFLHLGKLAESNYFLESHSDTNWKSALPYLYRNMAGMMLMGNFWTSQIPENLREKFSLFRFPQLLENMPFYEEAPTDLLIIPQNAKNKEGAAIFLNFMSGENIQFELNESLGMLAPQKNTRYQQDQYLGIGADILRAAQGLSQYYDRDNPQPIATEGMKQIKRFIQKPSDLEAVLSELEKLRAKSFTHTQKD
jgi:multiple sugar transport system substrate-binding protein